MAEPSLVLAKLDDDKLKDSINSLVNHLESSLERMKKSTTNAVQDMQQTLQSLGNIKVDTGGSADGDSSKRAKKQREETQAVNDTVAAYDKLAEAQQKASRKKGIEYMSLPSDVQEGLTYLVNVNKDVDSQLDSIIQKERAMIAEREKEAQLAREIAEQQSRIAVAPNGYAIGNSRETNKSVGVDLQRLKEATVGTEEFTQAIARLTNKQEYEINLANADTDSYNRLAKTLKDLQTAYNNMTAAERKSENGLSIRASIIEVEQAINRIKREASRPVSLDSILKIDPKTLDEVVEKMRLLQSYRGGIDITKPTAKKELEDVNQELNKLQKKQREIMGQDKQMTEINKALSRSWNYMKNRLAFYFTIGASTSFVKNLIEVRSQYEMNERALGILIDSAERGTQIFNELSQMALVSPYTLIELSAAAKQLTAYDVAAKDVVDTTRRLADMAAAVGIPIERLTYALGQIKAYGYLNSRDARMFANAGIPLVKQLSDYYTEIEGRLVSTADVYDRIKKKAIDYNEVMEVINKMTDQGGKFFDFQAKMADTLKVRLANLTLAWNNMLNDMGKESQGMLNWGIGALREMFLRWKQLDSLIKNAALVWGIRTALMFIAYSALKAGAALGVTNKQMALSSVFGTRLAGVLKTVAVSFKAIVTSPLTWWSLLAIAAVEATDAIFGVNEAQKALNESIRNGANNNYDNISKFIEQYKEVRDSLYKTVKKQVPDGMVMVTERTDSQGNKWHSISKEYTETLPQDIDKNEAKKAWEAVREQIELTVASSDKYIGNLLSISNMSERVRQGFNLLEDVQVVNAALKELDDDTIKVSQDFSAWWNAWQAPDGLIKNLKDYQNALDAVIAEYGTMESFRENTFLGGKGSHDLNEYQTALERFRNDLQKTTDSIINFIELKGWSGDESKINQVFEQITQKIVLDNQLDPQKAFMLQTEVEEARSKAAKEALLQRINDEKEAYKISHDEQLRQSINADVARYNSWNETNGRSKVEWERFTKWLKEQHISETTAMFRNMDAEDIKSLNFQEGKHAEWVTRMVTQYAKEHKMSYDEAFKYLRSWVRSANQWSIFIPLTISNEDKKSVYDQLGEYDKAVDEADAQIERLTKRINELNAKKKKSKEETQELADAEQELADAQKAKADAEAKGGHGKKEKKDRKADEKAAKQAETELQKALKDELSTIDKVRSIYKDLTKEGMSHANAVERATKGWDETINAINRVLQKNGLQKLDIFKFAGIENPRELVNMLQSQLNTLIKRGAKPAEIKELQTKIQTLNVDAEKYDLTKITNGLNNELGKLKDEYELAVELDADPELGNIFADYMGIDLNELPKNAEEAAKKAQQYIDKILRENKSKEKIDIASLMGKDAFDKWVKSSGHRMEDDLVKVVDNYRQALHKIQVDESKNQMQEWDKLLEKYAEYEYKRKQITEQYERELATARKKGANADIIKAITNRRDREYAQLDFNEFMKTPEWITATGDIANLSHKAIGMLIADLEAYKKKARNLDPKQIKQLNSALSKLYKEQRKNNPFKAISNMLEEARDRMATFDEEIQKTQEEVDDLTKKKKGNIVDGIADDETDGKLKKAISHLGKLKDKQKEAGNVDATTWVSSINETIAAVKQAISVFDDLAKAIGGVNGDSDVQEVFSILEKAGSSAAIGAQIGGGWGAVIGGVIGAVSGIISTFANSDNDRINSRIKSSELHVKKLELAYIDLEHAIDKAYGTATIAAKKAAIANKELQLAELKRQLTLEQSRDSKDRDDDRIIELQKQIKELQYDIKEASDEIINDLLGISSVGDAMDSLMDNFIEALRNGEDAMKVFDESVNNMIANMVKKMYVTKILQPWFESAWEQIQQDIEARSKNVMTIINNMMKSIGTDNAKEAIETMLKKTNFDPKEWVDLQVSIGNIPKELLSQIDTSSIEALAESLAQIYNSGGITLDDIKRYANALREGRDSIGLEMEGLEDVLKELGLMNTSKQLSALQQGIQGITEDTAGAIEAYLNGVSQQVYLHSDLLTQIRDTVVSFDFDVQLGVMSQMLMHLQNSYQTQQSIQRILENVLTPSGRAFAVEIN